MHIENKIIDLIKEKKATGKRGYGKIMLKAILPFKLEGYTYDDISKILSKEYLLEISAEQLRQFNSRYGKINKSSLTQNISKDKLNENPFSSQNFKSEKDLKREESDARIAEESRISAEKLKRLTWEARNKVEFE